MNTMLLSLLNWRILEEARYSVITTQGPFELRFYSRMLVARYAERGDYETTIQDGLALLRDYVEGCNFKVERLNNAGPFFQRYLDERWELDLLLSQSLSIDTAPKPINRTVKLIEVPPSKVSVLKFSGSLNPESVLQHSQELKRWNEYKGHVTAGNLRVSGIDLPLPLPFYRNNEVLMDVL